jgi:hypothetical protein
MHQVRSAVAEPPLEVAPVDDAEHGDDTVVVDHVVHDAKVADPESMKRISSAPDGLDPLATDATGVTDIDRQPLQRFPDTRPRVGRELFEGSSRPRRQPDIVCRQGRSPRPTVSPRA